LAVGDFQFTATPDKSDLEDLNSVGGALFALRGGDPTATERETEANLGQAAASLLVEHLIASGNFRVLERTNLDQVKTEQQLVASTAAQQGQTVAQQAKLIGAKYVISGQITKFGRSKKKKGGGFLGVVTKSIAGVGIESHQTEYDVGLTARIVDATTGEVVASFTTDGTAVGDAGRTIAGLGGVSGAVAGGLAGNSTSDERGKRITEALSVAVDRLIVQFVSAREKGDLIP